MNLGEIGSWATSIATVVAAIAVIMAAVIYQRQLDAMTKARQMESLILMMKYSEDLKLRKAGYFMFEHADELRKLFNVPFSWESRKAIDDHLHSLSCGEFGITDVDLSLDALNNICFLIRGGYAPAEAVEAFLKNSLVHAWHVFGPYAYRRRTRPDTVGEPSRYAAHLEWVVSKMCGNEGCQAVVRAQRDVTSSSIEDEGRGSR